MCDTHRAGRMCDTYRAGRMCDAHRAGCKPSLPSGVDGLVQNVKVELTKERTKRIQSQGMWQRALESISEKLVQKAQLSSEIIKAEETAKQGSQLIDELSNMRTGR